MVMAEGAAVLMMLMRQFVLICGWVGHSWR